MWLATDWIAKVQIPAEAQTFVFVATVYLLAYLIVQSRFKTAAFTSTARESPDDMAVTGGEVNVFGLKTAIYRKFIFKKYSVI